MRQLRPISSFLRRFPRAGEFLRRGLDLFPFTALGLVVSLASAYALRYFGFARLDLIALVIGYVGLGLPLVALLLVATGIVVLGYRLRRTSTTLAPRVDTTVNYSTGFSLPSAWFLPFIEVRWEWVEPASPLGVDVSMLHTFTTLRERVMFLERGVPSKIVRRVIVGDVFGLVRIAIWRKEDLTLEVLPHPGALKNVPALLSMAGGDDLAHPLGLEDGDRIDLRRYAPGDPARMIHWKVYGRTRKLVVRRPERALSQAKRTVAYLVAGPQDEASAAVARVALEGGALGGEWIFGADGTAGVIRDRDAALSAIAKSALAREEGGAGLDAFLREVEQEGPASIVLFVPPAHGPWVSRVQAALSKKRDARLVIGVDTLIRAPKPTWQTKLIRMATPSTGTHKERFDEVTNAFARLRVSTTLIERHTGRVLGEAHRRSLDAVPASAKRKVA